ncbi:hypothetical protein CcrSwift_gp246 [Caulobacter phage CcrSwift]|uniref:Uncharacterized protein n=1 Tax=Caulobacter phage CcrSwift TaxID=2927984 RepID=K4JT88_9CAUD|nr:hypothetical protein D870_gp175 [Caulobacter phage CcrSwift]AFU88564.1 hypothetical protein CcrSwift_gp246 [Caulobacter phage CcrSwift]
MSEKWQPVEEAANNLSGWNVRSAQMAVAGGTLYRTIVSRDSQGAAPAVSTTFIPDAPPQFTVQVTDEDLRSLAECKDVARARSLFRGILKAHGLEIIA